MKLLLALAFIGISLYAGAPKACDDKEHPGVAPCNMKSCQHMDKNGKPNGSRCSHYCTHKGICCRCAQNCSSDPAYNPEDEGFDAKNFYYQDKAERLLAEIAQMELAKYNDGLSSGRVD